MKNESNAEGVWTGTGSSPSALDREKAGLPAIALATVGLPAIAFDGGRDTISAKYF